MKVVILAGGFGTRISEETENKPKPMINIGGQPIILHIMKHYAKYGYNDFIICLGYKGYALKEYFANYYLHNSDITFDYSDNSQVFHQSRAEDWKVTLIDTGLQSMTGGRVKRAKKFISPDEPFMLTYGDGLSDVNISELVKAHESSEKICTVTAVAPPGRFGSLKIENNSVVEFQEKPLGDGGLINGGFLVCKHSFFNYIEGDSTVLEQEPLRKLASEGQLASFKHEGFWQPMDTLRDKLALEKMWDSGEAPWTK